MRVLICGDRGWTDEAPILGFLQTLNPTKDIIIEGGARGADRIAGLAAAKLGFTYYEFPAQWRQFGKAAGPIRNEQMLAEGKPDLVVAFHDDIEQSKGTKHMLKIAKKAGVSCMIVTHDKVLPQESTES